MRDAAASWRRAIVGVVMTAGVGWTPAVPAADGQAATDAVAASAASAAASAAPASTAALATACTACHGTTGQGQVEGGIPRLAGLSAAYLAAQMQAFRSGTRTDPVMEPIAASLDAAATTALAAHYAALPAADAASAPAAPASSAASVSASSPAEAPNRSGARGFIASLAGGLASDEKVDGKALAQRGNWKNGVLPCAQCHARDGLGVGDDFPPLAGQPAVYLANQLRAWQKGTRRNDPMGLMRSVARRLSSAQIDAVAAHYASLPAAAPRVEPRPPTPKSRSNRHKARR